ncbi:MAG TPA: hypothetical protein VEI04_04165 [Syntrophobacteria bacterium]|nr:hypothetical protein [Syntrophobacteria bacterium]
MQAVMDFEERLTREELEVVRGLDSPSRIQEFLDTVPYSTEEMYRCPLSVLRDRQAHCFDGALFAAAMLRRLGYPPRILELVPNDRDDEHLLAVYRRDGQWGAVGQSNFVGLRFREPLYRTLRELALSYFEQYYNVQREKTLRGYRGPLDLSTLDELNWMVSRDQLEAIAARLDRMRSVPLLKPNMAAVLAPVDARTYRAGLLGANERGLYRPSPTTSPPSGAQEPS